MFICVHMEIMPLLVHGINMFYIHLFVLKYRMTYAQKIVEFNLETPKGEWTVECYVYNVHFAKRYSKETS